MEPEPGLDAALAGAHPETGESAPGARTQFPASLGPQEAGSARPRPPSTLERTRVASRLSGFDSARSFAWREFCARFGASLNQAELLSVAQVLASEAGVKVDREAKRRKEVLIKWFDENYLAIAPILPRIRLENTDGKTMTGCL
jgi:hypothetical protein